MREVFGIDMKKDKIEAIRSGSDARGAADSGSDIAAFLHEVYHEIPHPHRISSIVRISKPSFLPFSLMLSPRDVVRIRPSRASATAREI